MTRWWESGIIYQVYPRSFQDASGDGIGDLRGVTQRIDYLAWLGINIIWISPMYPSPMADFGYDVSDYTDVHPMFGTLADMDELTATAHERGIKVLLDYVPNHSSDQHPWFSESRSSRDNPRRDWYVWRDPAPDGGPPNNWLSRFGGGPAWTFDETTGQYYLHSYLAEQPDLNWRNPNLRAAMLDVMRFWLDRGIDGFRVDAAYRSLKDPQLRDNPPNPDWREGMDPYDRLIDVYSRNFGEIHNFNRWLRAVVEEYADRLLAGELYLPIPELVEHYGAGDEFHLPFNFNLIGMPWEADRVRALVDEYEAQLLPGSWPTWVLGNHDRARFASRAGAAQARVGMLALLTFRGTPTIYYGDELGMTDVPIPPDRVHDPWELKAPDLGLGRDPVRTPMQWSDAPNAGFCPPDATPWLPLADDYRQCNVAVLRDDPGSILNFTRELIGLRQAHAALNRGGYRPLAAPAGLFAYLRESDDERWLVVLNFTDRAQAWQLPVDLRATLRLSTQMDRRNVAVSGTLELRGNEGLLLRVE